MASTPSLEEQVARIIDGIMEWSANSVGQGFSLDDAVAERDATVREILALPAFRSHGGGDISSRTDSSDARFSETAKAAQRKSEGGQR